MNLINMKWLRIAVSRLKNRYQYRKLWSENVILNVTSQRKKISQHAIITNFILISTSLFYTSNAVFEEIQDH